jgi:hypothetical protein
VLQAVGAKGSPGFLLFSDDCFDFKNSKFIDRRALEPAEE